ncbi:MAG TPA: hypothetical protein VFG09_07005 [Thermodesulfovibrionales bacterium]|jgi:hypothetical protein|nr:hypothetical protein [Thermodesulfovibrionales bacterium]
MKRAWRLLVIATTILVLLRCAAPPPEQDIRATIVKFFEERGYKVVDMTIGSARPVPLRKKRYMGTEGYLVDITSVTLEVTRDAGAEGRYKKGQRLVFTDGTVQIREKSDEKGSWLISNISGIPVI